MQDLNFPFIPVSAFGFTSLSTGSPLEKKSIIVANISGFINFQSISSSTYKQTTIREQKRLNK